jgi:hypothetical protein
VAPETPEKLISLYFAPFPAPDRGLSPETPRHFLFCAPVQGTDAVPENVLIYSHFAVIL